MSWLASVWRKEQFVPGLPLAEQDEIGLVEELAVRAVPGWDALIDGQLARTANTDRRERLAYVAPALAADSGERDRFFRSLRDAANRRREPWVLEGLQYLHHPLHTEQSVGSDAL